MAQFFSPDPHIQSPGNWYNYNRYAYCYNNPLIYTDPSGEFIWFAIAAGALLGSYLGGAAAEGWEYNPTKWAWDGNTWAGVGMGAVIGGAAGLGFYYAAPTLAKTGFFTHFKASGTVAAYTLTGGVAGGLTGYGAGLAGGMVYSSGDWQYSHQSGIHGAKVGASIGSVMGALTGALRSYRPEPDYDYKVNKAIDESLNNNLDSDLLLGELDPLVMDFPQSSLQMDYNSSNNHLHDYTMERNNARSQNYNRNSNSSASNAYAPRIINPNKSSTPVNYQRGFDWSILSIGAQSAIEYYWVKNPYMSIGMPMLPIFVIDPRMLYPEFMLDDYNRVY